MSADARRPKAGESRRVGSRPASAPPGKKAIPASGEESHLPWGRRNYVILGAGGGAVALGFILLALGDTVIAPILLVGGYLGLIPWGILASARPGAPGGDGSP